MRAAVNRYGVAGLAAGAAALLTAGLLLSNAGADEVGQRAGVVTHYTRTLTRTAPSVDEGGATRTREFPAGSLLLRCDPADIAVGGELIVEEFIDDMTQESRSRGLEPVLRLDGQPRAFTNRSRIVLASERRSSDQDGGGSTVRSSALYGYVVCMTR